MEGKVVAFYVIKCLYRIAEHRDSNKKLHIQLRLSVPAQKNHFERIEEVKSLAPIIWQDFKHSGPWDCEFCGKFKQLI